MTPVTDPASLPYLLKVEQLAALLQISEKAARRRIERGQVRGVTRQGGSVRIIKDVFLRSLRKEMEP